MYKHFEDINRFVLVTLKSLEIFGFPHADHEAYLATF